MSSEQLIFGEILGGSIFLPLKVCLEFTKCSASIMHLKNCFGYCIPQPGNSCRRGNNSRKIYSETINIDLVLSKPTCRKRNQMKRKSPEKSQQRITTQDTILGAIHTLALILFQDAKMMRSSKK